MKIKLEEWKTIHASPCKHKDFHLPGLEATGCSLCRTWFTTVPVVEEQPQERRKRR